MRNEEAQRYAQIEVWRQRHVAVAGEPQWMPRIASPLQTASILQQVYGRSPFHHRHVKLSGIVSVEALRAAVARGLVIRVRHGEYMIAPSLIDVETVEDKRKHDLQAALGVVSEAVISHHSAAMMHGLPEVGSSVRFGLPTFTRPGDHHANGEEFRISGSRLEMDEIVEFNGVQVTSLARTAIDVARHVKMPDGLAIVDAASRLMIARAVGLPSLTHGGFEQATQLRDAVRDPLMIGVVREQFQRSIGRMTKWKGIGWARLAVRHMNPAAESVLESISRWHMVDARLPPPKIGFPMVDGDGVTRWLDFWWPNEAVIGEADGFAKYQKPEALISEKLREDALRAVVGGFVRWNWTEAVVNPHIMIRKIRRALLIPA